jgi:hypothetical protein
MISATKKEELFLFDEFRRLRPDFVFSRIEQLLPPAPDILAHLEGTRIGVEITRHLRQHEKRRESEEDAVVRLACQKYRELGCPPVGVSFYWGEGVEFKRSNREELAQMLAEAVAKNIPPRGTWKEVDWNALPQALAECVDLHVDRVIDYLENDWRIPRARFIPPLLPTHVLNVIGDKERYFVGYSSCCEKVWLLIASEGKPSSWWDIPHDARQVRYPTRFSRVFLLGSNPRQVVELCVQQP